MFLTSQLPHRRIWFVYEYKPNEPRLWGWGVGKEEMCLSVPNITPIQLILEIRLLMIYPAKFVSYPQCAPYARD